MKQRLETGLSFIGFNYMILPAHPDCEFTRPRPRLSLQINGDDRWSNFVVSGRGPDAAHEPPGGLRPDLVTDHLP
ncbi:MAG: hypothetical protein IPM94_06990 [bacterium]|nr:hypothetical protein [bacterium]